jgi:hypothetical protein
MTISEFKQAVASFAGREPEYFQDNVNGKQGPDKLMIAINNAKLFLQRQIDFEYARVMVDLHYVAAPGRTEGASLKQALLHGTTDPINVKKVISLFTQKGFERMTPLRQKTFRGVSEMMRKALDLGEYPFNPTNWNPQPSPAQVAGSQNAAQPLPIHGVVAGHSSWDPIFYQHGTQLFLYPKPPVSDPSVYTDDLSLVADVIQLLPPYSETYTGAQEMSVEGANPLDDNFVDNSSDFLLENCYDYLLFRSLVELNVFMKDSDQVGVSQTKMTEALENIRQWNADLINAGYDIE